MGLGDTQVEPQGDDGYLLDQKHQAHMRTALDLVCHVCNVLL